MNKVDYNTEGVLFNIQRYSLHDGPGIRTIAFFKGCPLSCKWCSNPESQQAKPQLIFKASDCINCGKCTDACKVGAIPHSNPQFIDRDKCVECGACVDVCPTGALEIKGKRMTVEQVLLELRKDENLFRRAGGGITLSGGEPLAQPEFARELLKGCKEKGWHTAIETTGIGSKQAIEEVFPWIDLALVDIKAINPTVHKAGTGVDNRIILENILRISLITKVTVRIPIIPGFNDNEEEIQAIAQFAQMMSNVDTIHLLPYHNYGENKYPLLGLSYPLQGIESNSDEKIDQLKSKVESMGFTCHVGG